ncbi:MAG TPA: GTP-binding protein [Ignavibacteriaceae bacterium]|nr:GTP-binding protein [Ignavibacteriaceae bacterium]
MDILRFIAAGSVDDGKSTLIGRLLYDSKSVLMDQLESISKPRNPKLNSANGEEINLAFLTDGLRAEREQGITIDVAYKYFSTPKRKFIIADTPGHFEFTRNMVTGASNSDLAIILIDARHGMSEQTKRHSIIASILNIPHLVICINKMDLVNYSEKVFSDIVEDYKKFASKLNIKFIYFIPISALLGDNIVERSFRIQWYSGRSLLEHLEEVCVEPAHHLDSRFPVQWIISSHNGGPDNYTGYTGKIISGVFKKGDKILISNPFGTNGDSFKSSSIKSIEIFGSEVEEAFAPMSVVMHLHEKVDIHRGDLFVKASGEESLPVVNNNFEAIICWMDAKPLRQNNNYLLQHNSRIVECRVEKIVHKIDVNTLDELINPDQINLNDICRVRVQTASSLIYDPYPKNKANGNFILIDKESNTTAGAGMIC